MMINTLSIVSPKATLSQTIHKRIEESAEKVFKYVKSRSTPEVPLSDDLRTKSVQIINELRKSAKDSENITVQSLRIKSPNILLHEIAEIVLQSQFPGEKYKINTDTFEMQTAKEQYIYIRGKYVLTKGGQSIEIP